MANVPPLEIKIDPDAIRDQVLEGITDALRETALMFHMIADSLDPTFLDEQEKWIEEAINSKVEARLRLKETEK